MIAAPPRLSLQENIRDKLHPIVLSMNYSLVEKPRSFQLGPRSLDAFPVLNQDQSHKNETKVGCPRPPGDGDGGPGGGGTRGVTWGHPRPPDRVPEGVRLRQQVLQQPAAAEQLRQRAESIPAQVSTGGPSTNPARAEPLLGGDIPILARAGFPVPPGLFWGGVGAPHVCPAGPVSAG